MITVEFRAGTSIEDAARKLVFTAPKDPEHKATGTFNDITLVCDAYSTSESIVACYHSESKRCADERRKSPEGIKARQEQEDHDAARAKINNEVDRAIAGVEMRIFDHGAWSEFVSKNTDPYGAGVIKYAERWAKLMQVRMGAGAKLEDIAKQASHDTDNDGITGFMYGCAVATLAKTWEHGDELRRWHNLDSQYGNEGEKANETGGVLNPALLSVRA
jgi:hypothetical protein